MRCLAGVTGRAASIREIARLRAGSRGALDAHSQRLGRRSSLAVAAFVDRARLRHHRAVRPRRRHRRRAPRRRRSTCASGYRRSTSQRIVEPVDGLRPASPHASTSRSPTRPAGARRTCSCGSRSATTGGATMQLAPLRATGSRQRGVSGAHRTPRPDPRRARCAPAAATCLGLTQRTTTLSRAPSEVLIVPHTIPLPFPLGRIVGPAGRAPAAEVVGPDGQRVPLAARVPARRRHAPHQLEGIGPVDIS